MNALMKRLHRLEAQSFFGSPGRPRETLRVVVQSVCGPAKLETSRCTRTLQGNGLLTEFVHELRLLPLDSKGTGPRYRCALLPAESVLP